MKFSIRACLRALIYKVIPVLAFTAIASLALYILGFKEGCRATNWKFQANECWVQSNFDVVCIEYIPDQ